MIETSPIDSRGTIVRRPDFDPNGVDVFIIHGKNWKNNPGLSQMVGRKAQRMLGQETKPFRLRLSKDSKTTALAAGVIWREYRDHGEKPPILIFSTGKTAGESFEGQVLPSEAEAMVEYLKVRFPDIPPENIKLEDKSHDTATNIKNSKGMINDLREEGITIRRVGYLTVGYHLPRVYILMNYYDLPIQKIHPSEQILRARSRRHNAFVEGYTHSKEWKKHERGEALLRIEATFDPGQKVLSSTTAKVIRHQNPQNKAA